MHTEAYLEKDSDYFGWGRPEMLPFIPEGITSLLDVGCASGAFGAMLKAHRSIRVTGIEPHQESALAARARLDHVVHGGAEAAAQELAGQHFDCITFNDVLEHLVDPWETLRQVRPLLRPGGVIVASIPNVRHLSVSRDYLFNGRWEYQAAGVLDRTHLRFFTRSSMRDLFTTSGFEVLQQQGINRSNLTWKLKILSLAFRDTLEDMRCLQYVCVARPEVR